MKKFLYSAFIFILFFLIGCTQNEEDFNIEETADKIVNTIDLPSETKENLVFQNTFTIDGKVFDVSWLPNDTNVVDSNGNITRGFQDQNISIEILIEKDNQKVQRNLGTITILGYSKDEVSNALQEIITIPNIISEVITLPNTVTIFGEDAILTWSSTDPNVIKNNKITLNKTQITTDIFVSISVMDTVYDLSWNNITVSDAKTYINKIMNAVEIPTEIKSDITLLRKIDDVYIDWTSDKLNVLSNSGKWYYQESNTEVILTALFFYNGVHIEKDYTVNVLTYTNQERFNLVLENITLPDLVSQNLNLQTAFAYNVSGTWESSNPNIIENNGLIKLTNKEEIITLKLTLYSGEEIMTKDFTVTTKALENNEVYFNNHMLVERANEMNTSNLSNLIYDNEKIVLNQTAIEGYYESPIYLTNQFDSLVGSWAAISNQNATCELQIKVRVNGTWSSYLSYQPWGLGLHNALSRQDVGLAKMSADELVINNYQKADALQYKITLRRTSVAFESPKLTLVGIALSIPNYTFDVDVSNLPKQVDYDVPKLYQHDVPEIGGSICSITSSTMLLLYKGHKFTDSLPHREVAPLFFDYGNNIYGNWVYNTVGMSSYGETSYVKRIYSWEELQYQLATVGPIALSIRGNTGLYTTNGHLIVVRGYEITDSGTFIICNDPNVQGVYVKYPLETYKQFTRNVIYVVE